MTDVLETEDSDSYEEVVFEPYDSESHFDPSGSALECDEPGCAFATNSSSGLKRHRTRSHGAKPTGHSPGAGPHPPAGSAPGDESAPEAEQDVTEVPPRPPRPPSRGGLLGRVRARFRPDAGAAPSSPKPKRSAPARGKRISIASDISESYFGLGRELENTPHYPAGRMLTYQAPAAGVVIDKALAGTLVDRAVIQPLWRHKDRYEDILYLATPPVLLITMQNVRMRQQTALAAGDEAEARRLQAILEGEGRALAWVLRSSLLRLAPAMAEARKRAEEEDEVIREAFPGLPPGEDPVKQIMMSLFTPPGEHPQPEEAAASDHDRASPD